MEMLDELAEWGPRPPLLTADGGHGQVAEFRQGLTAPGVAYIVATTSSTTAQPSDAHPVPVPYTGVSKHPILRFSDKWEHRYPAIIDSGPTRGPSSCHSCASTWRSARSCAPPTPSSP